MNEGSISSTGRSRSAVFASFLGLAGPICVAAGFLLGWLQGSWATGSAGATIGAVVAVPVSWLLARMSIRRGALGFPTRLPIRHGDQISGWRVVREIDRPSSVGRVYEVAKDGTRGVLKLYSPGTIGKADPAILRRLERESRFLYQAQSPYIARYVDSGQHQGNYFLVTQYVGDQDLEELVADRGNGEGLPDEMLFQIAFCTSDALRVLHDEGIVHRDVKPGNVYMAPACAVLGDLGIAWRRGATSLTRTGAVLGTLPFLAPEQIGGSEPDPASDVFAWGSTMCFAATEHPPFDGTNDAHLMTSIVSADPHVDGCPDWLRPLILAALAKAPTDRPPAERLVSDLRGMGAQRGWDVGLPVAEQVREPRSAPKAAAAVVAVAAVVAAAVLVPRVLSEADPTVRFVETRVAGNPICSAVWNHAGTAYATVTEGRGLALFEANGDLIRELAPLQACYLAGANVQWDPSDRQLAIVSEQPKGLFTVDAATGRTTRLGGYQPGVGDTISWSRDASLVAFRSVDGVELIPTGGGTRKPRTLDDDLHFGVSFSPTDDLIALGAGADEGPFFEVVSYDGEPVASVGSTAEVGSPTALAFDPSGELVAAAVEDYGMEIWRWRSGTRVATLLGPDGAITDVRWSGDGRFVMTTSHDDQLVHVFRASDWKLVGAISPHEMTPGGVGVAAASIRSDGTVLLVPQGSQGIDVFRAEA